jgi:hypothetical protein
MSSFPAPPNLMSEAERKIDGTFLEPTLLKYGMTDPGMRVDPRRIEEMQARIFCRVRRPVAA